MHMYNNLKESIMDDSEFYCHGIWMEESMSSDLERHRDILNGQRNEDIQ
jgi:hypothetical protein